VLQVQETGDVDSERRKNLRVLEALSQDGKNHQGVTRKEIGS